MAVATASPASAPAPAATMAAPAVDVDRRRTALVGTGIAIVADAAVLAGLLAAYFSLRATSFAWPPRGVSHAKYLPAVVSLTVVMSVTTAQWAAWALRRGDRRNTLIGLVMTMFFGIAIVNAEWYSFGHHRFSTSSHAFGTIVNSLIGFHLVNVLVGIAALAVVLVRTLAGAAHEERPGPGAAAALFWHFTVIAWLVIFVVLYVVG
jgi:cytochrome c oxidase subunit I+III